MVLSAPEILGRLYPPSTSHRPAPEGVRRSGRAARPRMALPTLATARLVLPSDPDLAARSLRTMRRGESATGRLTTSVVAGALAAGAGRALPRGMGVHLDSGAWSVEDEIGEVLGRPVRAAIFLGPPRSNRKPVLHLYDETDALVAVAKVAIDDLTARLVRAEAAALRVLGRASWSQVEVPQLLAEHQWNGFPMVLQSPLPIWEGGADLDGVRRTAAFSEISRCAGVVRERLVASDYLRALRAQVDTLEDRDIGAGARAVLDSLSRAPGGEQWLEFGAWHGDLTRWNMAVTDQAVLVWDWERLATGVPLGFDALHHAFLPALKVRRTSPAAVARNLLASAPRLLGPVGNREGAATVAMLYLIELAVRFTVDRQASTGVAGGDARQWLLPILHAVPSPENGCR